MSQVLPSFPDGEDVIMSVLESLATTVQTTPPDFEPPMIQVRQTGGTSERLHTRPLIEVAFFGGNYESSKELASTGEQMLIAASGTTVHNVPGHPNGVLVDKIQIVQSPREVAYEDPDKRRKTTTIRMVMRRPRALVVD